VFDQGQIIEDGSHAELLAKNGRYAQLWNAQISGFIPVGTDKEDLDDSEEL
jgi:ABC-type transport system involved in cytochrome bd biosynthesis fused ATPase/permease subunit